MVHLAALMAAEIKAGERSVTTAMREAGGQLKIDWRHQITGAGLGQRLAWSIRADTALSAVTTLQLGAAHAEAGSPGMIPPPGVLHVIEAPDAAARERVEKIVNAMIDAGATAGVQKPRVVEQAGSP